VIAIKFNPLKHTLEILETNQYAFNQRKTELGGLGQKKVSAPSRGLLANNTQGDYW